MADPEVGRFLSAERHADASRKQLEMTPQTLARLRELGVAPGTELKLEYFFYSNAPSKAEALAEELRRMGYSAKCEAAARDPSLCVVKGWTTPLAMDEEPLVAWTGAMSQLGYANDCEFDGWGTPIPSASGPAACKYEKLPPARALEELDRYRREFGKSKIFPFIVGDEKDRYRFERMIKPPADGGARAIQDAKDVDLAAWLADHELPEDGPWPANREAPGKAIQILYDTSSRKLKQEVYLALIRIENSWEAFGALGFGGWNDCPEARIHVAIHKRWRDRYGSSPIVISADVVECHVSRPPDNEQAALELAREQYAFCPDIVDQGTETISALAASLLGSPRWYFWWD